MEIIDKKRVCKKCNIVKKINEFNLNSHTCKICYKLKRKTYFKNYYMLKKNHKIESSPL